ncbi:MAG: acyl-CoA dehydrogenase family protein [Chloroflexia bacterium]
MRDDTLLEESWRPLQQNGTAVAEPEHETDQDAAVRDLLASADEIAAASASEAAALDEEGRFPAAAFARIRAAGLLAAPLPRALGGLGLGSEPGCTLPLLRVLKSLGRGDLSVARIYEGHVNALFLIGLFGTAAQRERAAADARAGKLFAVWNTEGGDGVHFAPLPEGGYRLAGSKLFTSGSLQIERALIGGKLPDGGWQLCLVPMDEVRVPADASVWKPLGMRASVSHKVDFTGVRSATRRADRRSGRPATSAALGSRAGRSASPPRNSARRRRCSRRRAHRPPGSRDRTGDPFQRVRAGEAAIACAAASSGCKMRQAYSMRSRRHCAPTRRRTRRPRQRSWPTRISRGWRSTRPACTSSNWWIDRDGRGLLRPHPVERIGRDLRLYLRQPAPDAALATAGAYALETEAPAERLWAD